MSRNRSKAKGRRDPNERYAYLPRDMLQSPAYRSLTHAEKSYLTALAAECNGYNNGQIKFTKDVAKKYGLTSAETRCKALACLHERGFIQYTAKVNGPNPHRHCDYIRLTWHRMYEFPKWNLPEMEATNDWLNWSPDV